MGEPHRPGRGLAVLTLLVALCQACLFPGALFGGESFLLRDLEGYYRPAKSLVAPLWSASGGLPLWNPFFASGQPFAANPEHELFHPLTALFLLLPFETAFRLQVIVPLVVAALSMLLLLTSLGLRTEAALLGSVSWGIGGYTLSTTNLLPILFAVAVLPAVLAFAVRFVTHGGARNLAGLAVSLGLECLAGEPSTLLMTAPLLLVVMGHLALERGGPDLLRRRAAGLAGGLALGVALGAAALLPGLDHASKTVRVGGLPDATANRWSMPPIRVAELALPRVLGHLGADDREYWGHRLYPAKDYPFLFSIYPGLLLTLLAGVEGVRQIRKRWPWILVAALGVLLAVGSHLFVWRHARDLVPILRGLRYPEKFVLLTVFAVTVLGSVGFDSVLRRIPGHRRGLFRSVAVAGLLATCAALALLLIGDVGSLPERLGFSPRGTASWAQTVARDLLATGALAVVALLALVSARGTGWLLVGLTAGELVLAGRPLVPTQPVAWVTTPPAFLASLARPGTPALLFHYAAHHPTLGSDRNLRAPPVPSQWGIATTLESDFDLTELRWSHRATDRFFEVVASDASLFPALLRRRGVTAVLRFRPGLDARPGETPFQGRESPVQLFLLKDPNPFAFCASRLVRAEGEEGWMEAVRRLGPDAAQAAVVASSELDGVPAEVSTGRVRILESTPQRLVLDVEAHGPHPTFVAINQTWDEGWRLLVDGGPGRLLRTDLSLSGLLLPPGRHRVELTYSNPWVTAGVLVSLASLCVIALLLALGRRGREEAAAVPVQPRQPEGAGEYTRGP